ncbi:GH3 auxin-responsive promoter [Pontibacter ummariensis]|uniref:GH3 auxin-responsive promoter n=1 Tax=Pontibacter ummariensis TaxID=1610492 RepID=A0A239IDJ1_9BACT|nr:GH3 auxin-responsive promoter family protein [Pontibacter ummariensis]PRY09961.1 GH3 auxin-responsive promoter [Pontibacter ummariensis]SNS90494.1 GH3 auxin-responsive promoter [Pontibacter ummariensis]
MELLNLLISQFTKKRVGQIEHFMEHPHEVQHQTLKDLLAKASQTEWGQRYKYAEIKNAEAFRQRVPVSAYDDISQDIKRMLQGEHNILWPSKIKWFAKSSGTTSDRSKFIPVSQEALEDCHFRGGKDMITLYLERNPDSRLFLGKAMSVGGTLHAQEDNEEVSYGAISAIVTKNLPIWAEFARTPSTDIAFLPWEEKLDTMAHTVADQNITSIMGLPTWTHVVLERVLEVTGKENILEVWPNLEFFAHGGVAFGPYRELFRKLLPSDDITYIDIYNASEGFFGLQDGDCEPDEMLLMLDYGVYYEFIPMDEFGEESPRTVGLDQVQAGKNYAMVITTNAGLWRYKIGDTVRFTSTSPYRFKISGRVKHFINAFGEELMVENAERAMAKASEATGAMINEFTAAPVFTQDGQKGRHEWLVEFARAPRNLDDFAKALDEALRELNSDYDSRRHQDLALLSPIVHKVSEGTFYNWMKKRGKLGGQNKVPRLSNSREFVEDILAAVSTEKGTL